jgi:hypothetical protein
MTSPGQLGTGMYGRTITKAFIHYFRQGYDLTPPSICLRNNATTCGQGDVPLYSVEVVTVEDIQVNSVPDISTRAHLSLRLP